MIFLISPDIIGICETWLSPSIDDNGMNIPSYVCQDMTELINLAKVEEVEYVFTITQKIIVAMR